MDTSPVHFCAEHDDIPFILGRLDIFGKFNIKFDEMEIHIERRNE